MPVHIRGKREIRKEKREKRKEKREEKKKQKQEREKKRKREERKRKRKRSVPKPLKVPSLARSVPKPLKASSRRERMRYDSHKLIVGGEVRGTTPPS